MTDYNRAECWAAVYKGHTLSIGPYSEDYRDTRMREYRKGDLTAEELEEKLQAYEKAMGLGPGSYSKLRSYFKERE